MPVLEPLDLRFAKALMGLKYRHIWSDSAVGDMAKTISSLFPGVKLPRSIYKVKQLAGPGSYVTKILCACYCCGTLLLAEERTCDNDVCKNNGTVEKFLSRGYIWASMEIKLRGIFEGSIAI